MKRNPGKMRITNNSPNSQKALLKRYLSRFGKAREEQRILSARLVTLKTELEKNGTPPPKNGKKAGKKAHLSEAEKILAGQCQKTEAALLDVMRMIDLLPENSTEKIIMGLRYIDCRAWKDIAKQVHLSRSPCFAYHENGLRLILKSKQAQKILASYEAKTARGPENKGRGV